MDLPLLTPRLSSEGVKEGGERDREKMCCMWERNVAGKGRTFTNKVQPHCENKAYQERLTSSAREGEGERERETKKDWETEKEREEIDR